MGNEVSNDYLGADIPEITTQTGTTPKELYRCSDNKYLKLTKLVLTNQDTATTQVVKIVDADLIDTNEDTYKGEAYRKLSIEIGPQDTMFLNNDDFGTIYFRYGVCGYNSTSKSAGSGVLVRVVGEEISGA